MRALSAHAGICLCTSVGGVGLGGFAFSTPARPPRSSSSTAAPTSAARPRPTLRQRPRPRPQRRPSCPRRTTFRVHAPTPNAHPQAPYPQPQPPYIHTPNPNKSVLDNLIHLLGVSGQRARRWSQGPCKCAIQKDKRAQRYTFDDFVGAPVVGVLEHSRIPGILRVSLIPADLVIIIALCLGQQLSERKDLTNVARATAI